jgi:hypothetical protein
VTQITVNVDGTQVWNNPDSEIEPDLNKLQELAMSVEQTFKEQ